MTVGEFAECARLADLSPSVLLKRLLGGIKDRDRVSVHRETEREECRQWDVPFGVQIVEHPGLR